MNNSNNIVISRRSFLKDAAKFTIGFGALSAIPVIYGASSVGKKPFFQISLAEYSFHRALQSGSLNHLAFPATAKSLFDIDAVEYVSFFFKETTSTYLSELKTRAKDAGVKNLLIMVSREGNLATPNEAERLKAIDSHVKWLEAAAFLGCHTVRVDLRGGETREQAAAASVKSLSELSERAKKMKLNVVVENHGGYSSDGKWLSGVLKEVGLNNCGSLPDFGNFWIDRAKGEQYDRYLGTQELMPYAKAVSAKAYDFAEDGNETSIDYLRMLQIVKEAGYRGYIGIEYEGKNLSEEEGIRATIKLLQKASNSLS